MALTEPEEEKLRQLLAHVNVFEVRDPKLGLLTELRLRNVASYTTIEGAGAVLVIDARGTNGVQRPIDIRGPSKCIICDEYNQEGLVCKQCRTSISIMRALSRMGAVNELMEKLDNLGKEGLLEALELVTRENIQNWMLSQAEEMK